MEDEQEGEMQPYWLVGCLVQDERSCFGWGHWVRVPHLGY